MSTVLISYDALDNDIQELSEISKHTYRNLSLTCELKEVFPLQTDSDDFISLRSSVDLLDLLSSTLTEMNRKGMIRINRKDDHFFGPLHVEKDNSKLAYAVSLQQKRIQHIKKSLQFVIGNFAIPSSTFLKPLSFGYDFRKHFIALYPNFGLSLYEVLNDESRRTWDLQQALSITFALLEASKDFLQAKQKSTNLSPDLGPQFILVRFLLSLSNSAIIYKAHEYSKIDD